MAITVDNLQVEIVANANNASNSIKSLCSSLERLKGICETGLGLRGISKEIKALNRAVESGTTKSIKDLAKTIQGGRGAIQQTVQETLSSSGSAMSDLPQSIDGASEASARATSALKDLDGELKQKPKDAGKASSAIKKVGDEVKKAGEKSKKASGFFGKLLSSLGRIAFYRAIRSAMKAITSGVSEGMKNLIQYSALVKDTDSAMAHSVTSEYATQFLYLKNSIGSAVAPMIQSLLPAIKQVVAWFVEATNAVNQFISALQGKSTYTKAKEYAQDTAEGLQDAVGSAKELKKQLQGFDELNNLSFQDASGGSSTTTPDYSQMFEEADIDSKWKDIAQTFEDLLPIIEGIGIALFGWKLASPFLSNLADVSGTLGRIADIAKGAILITIGVILSYNGGVDLASNDVPTQIKGAIESAVGTGLSAVGGYMIGGVIGLAIGVALSVVATVAGLYKGTKERCEQEVQDLFYGTQEGALLKALQEKIDDNAKNAIDLKLHVDSITGEIDSETQVKLTEAKNLIDEIFTLDAKDNKTAKEIEKIKDLVKTLNGLGLDGIQLEFDDTTGHVNKTKKEVTNLITELEREYKTEALRESLTQLYKDEAEAMVGLQSAQEDLANAQKIGKESAGKLTDATNEYNEALKAFNDFCEQHALDTASDLSNGTDDLSKTFTKLKNAVNNADTKVRTYEKGVNESNNAVQKARATVDKYSTVIGTTKKKINQFTTALDNMNKDFDAGTDKISDFLDQIKKLNNTNIIPKTMQVAIKMGVEAEVESVIRTVNNTPSQNVVMGKASGGYVPNSTLFYANEDGNPEYVGNMNGHTAVANSGQMAEAIESASYRGMSRALQENGGSDGYEVIWDSQKVFGVMKKEASAYTRRTGNMAFS